MTLRRPYGGRKVAVRLRKVFKQHCEQNSLREEFLNMFKILHDVSTPHEIGTVIVRPLTAMERPSVCLCILIVERECDSWQPLPKLLWFKCQNKILSCKKWSQFLGLN